MLRATAFLAGWTIVQGAVSTADSASPRVLRPSSLTAQFWVERAVEEAARRLSDEKCQQVLTDFQNGEGRPLSKNLAKLSMTPSEFVLRGLWYVDATNDPPCRDHDRRAAFTESGSRVIFLCSARLASPNFPSGASRPELLIIHEALHALGLGENPPTPAAITKQVARRC